MLVHLITKNSRIPTSCSFFTANLDENLENASIKLETMFASWSRTDGLTLQKMLQATVYTRNFGNCCKFFQKTSNIRNKDWTGWEDPRYISSEQIDQIHLTMESFTTQWVSSSSAQLFPDNTLSFLPNFNRSHWNWKVNGRLQCRKYVSQQCTKKSLWENSCFLVKIINLV